ncbi:MAG: hypothetical protein ACRCXD_04945 [Luteolibacter sp.]
MKQSHFLFAGACIVSLGIGYMAGGSRASSAAATPLEEKTANPRQARSSSGERQNRETSGDEMLASILKGRALKDLSDGEVAKIVVQLSKYDPTQSPVAQARQNYQLRLLLEKLPASRLEEAAAAIAADPESQRTGGVNTIMNAMASKDPQRALAWAKTQKNTPGLLASVLGTMAKDDPMTAADLYREGLLDGTFSQNDGWQASYGIGRAMAQLGKKALLSFMDSLPQQQQSNVLANCFRELPESDRVEMMDDIYQRSKEGRMRDWSFKNIFNNALSTDRAQAEAWLAKMEPGKERASLELSTANIYSRNGDAEAAREWMSRAIAQSAGREKELLKEAINQMGYNSPGDIAIFASLLPEGTEIKADDLKNEAQNSMYRGFGGLMGLAGAIRDPAEQALLLTTALEEFTKQTGQSSDPSRVNSTDFEIFTRQLQTLNLTGENATQVAEALAAARSATPKARD